MEILQFFGELFMAGLGWVVANKEAIGAFVGSAVVISAIQQFIKRWMSSDKVIHTSLLILSTLIGLGDLAVIYSVPIVTHLPATIGGLFTIALSFYRYIGKSLFSRVHQFFLDAQTGKASRQTEQPTLPIEEFAV